MDATLSSGVGEPLTREAITLASWLGDQVPMPDEVRARLLALEGVQPSLHELRIALCLGLDLSRVWYAYEALAPDFAQPQSDAQLAAIVDAMYRAVAGSCTIQVRLDAAGEAHATRDTNAIALREGESLALLVVISNDADVSVQCTIEARSAASGAAVGSGRTCALLVDAGPMPAGSYLLPLSLFTNGNTTTVDLPVECAPAGTMSVRLLDRDSGEALAARVYCSDARGPVAPAGVPLRRDRSGNAWFHADGAFEAIVSGRARLEVVRGIEYEPASIEFDARPDADIRQDMRLRRWSHMAADCWRSGDVHVHLHYGGELEMTAGDASLAQRAEDIGFLHMMVANCDGGGTVLDGEHFSGAHHEVSDGEHILQWGEEYRNNLYGHLCLVAIPSLIEPIFTGVRFSARAPDFPANAVIADAARAASGTVTYAHPVLYDGLSLNRVFAETRNVEAKELPVDAALGHIDAVDVMSYPGKNLEVAELWYRLLNCGLRLAATAGTDTFMNVTDSTELKAFPNRDFSSPPGGQRAFVRIEGDFTAASWCDGVRRGETFVTNGPMIDFSVNGRGIGSELAVDVGEVLVVEVSAGSWFPMDRIELIVNGAVEASSDAEMDGRFAQLSHQFVVTESCWLAVRVVGPARELVLDEALFAHTSPIYVLVDGQRTARAEDAAYFVDWIDRLCAMTESAGHFESAEQRREVVDVFREGQVFYRRIAGLGPPDRDRNRFK